MTRFHYASTHDSNMLYLVQRKIIDPFFFLEHDGKKHVFLSSIDIDAFKETSHTGIEAVELGLFQNEANKYEGDKLTNLALCILKKYGCEKAITVPQNFPVGLADILRENSVLITVQKDWCPERVLKSPVEISMIKDTAKKTIEAYKLVEHILHDSQIKDDTILYKGEVLSSEFLKREIAKKLLEYDLENTAGLIVSCGTHSAMPHHVGNGPILPHQTIIVDIFPQSSVNHYFVDMTRTYVKGTPDDKIIKMYETVNTAKYASLSALTSGMSCKEIYDVSAQVILAEGFDVGERGYIHSLGHGLGVSIHEAPSLSKRSTEILQSGQVVAIEPGLYYPEIGGVRLEDTVVITEDGFENITDYSSGWVIS